MDFDFFSFGKSDPRSAANDAEINPAGSRTTAPDPAAAQAIESVSTSRRKPGRPKGSGKTASSAGGMQPSPASPELQAEIERQLEKCYDPKTWGALYSAPGDAMLAISGRKLWNISNAERETLGAVGSVSARFLMITNPRALAFLMLGAGLFSAYIPRLTEHFREVRAEVQAKAEKK